MQVMYFIQVVCSYST